MAPITIKIVVGEDAVDFGLHLTGTDKPRQASHFYYWPRVREREKGFGNGGENERGMKRWR